MKTTVTRLEDNKVRLEIEVQLDEMSKQLDRAARDLSAGVSLPGFRKGKIPRKVLERHVGVESIMREAVRYAVPDFLADAIIAEDLDVIGRPEIGAIDGGIDSPLVFEATVDLRPEIEVGDVTGVEVRLDVELAPSSADVDTEVEALRSRFGDIQDVDRPAQQGDHVLLNIEGEAAGEAVEELTRQDYLHEVGSSTLVPELDENLVGAKAGDVVAFTATLPDEAPLHGGEELSFRVLVKQVKERVLPELTDEWVSEASEFETVEELRAEVAKTMGGMRRMQARQEAQQKAIEALVERTGLKVPESVVSDEIDARIAGMARDLERRGASLEQYVQLTGDTIEAMRERFRDEAVRAVESALLLRALAGELDLEATGEEVATQVEIIAARADKPVAKVQRELERAGQLASIAGGIIRAKALSHLLENVSVVDAAGQLVDLSADSGAEGEEPAEGGDGPGEPGGAGAETDAADESVTEADGRE